MLDLKIIELILRFELLQCLQFLQFRGLEQFHFGLVLIVQPWHSQDRLELFDFCHEAVPIAHRLLSYPVRYINLYLGVLAVVLELFLQFQELLVAFGLENFELHFQIRNIVAVLDLQFGELLVEVGNPVFVGLLLLDVHLGDLLRHLEFQSLLLQELLKLVDFLSHVCVLVFDIKWPYQVKIATIKREGVLLIIF